MAIFSPIPGYLTSVGLERGEIGVLVVVRSAHTGAAYDRLVNPHFLEALRTLSRRDDVTSVVLPRRMEEARAIESLALRGVRVARQVVDSRSLILLADAFVGAGGTMTREAAVLGVPTYSLFAGRRPEVDAWLERQGSLRTVDSVEQLAELSGVSRRPEAAVDLDALRARAKAIEDVFVSTTMSAAAGRRR